ncbi:hypothetical protein AYO38_10735 [bacterium SCGC AG-212-C10]|nr:hypothetical protein AYO38_10735 [bacterium SCGC AG-212-C10]
MSMAASTFPQQGNGLSFNWRTLFAALQGFVSPAAPGRVAPRAGIDRLKQREPGAWQELFAQESAALYRYVHSRTGDEGESEDIVSQIFEEAWKHIGSFEDRGLPPRAWLFGIARNLVGTHRRRWLGRPRMLALESLDVPADEPGMDATSMDLARAVASLSRSHSEVITLRFLHGLSIQETAAVLETSVDGIKGRQSRALQELRKKLSQ